MKKKKQRKTKTGSCGVPTKPSIRLMPELIPKPLHGISLYRRLPRKQWESIRQQELMFSGNCCAICSDEGPGLTCHEQWFYDNDQCIAVLIGFEIHCQECDLVTHMGRASRVGLLPRAVAQFCKVNSASVAERMLHLSTQ
jgi:hypothetical protein